MPACSGAGVIARGFTRERGFAWQNRSKRQTRKTTGRRRPTRAGKPSSDVGPIESVIVGAAVALGKVWNAVTADGMLAAAGRQGIDELGAALKAFPDSIQVQETGTLWNPTQGEIAADRQHSRHGGSLGPVAAPGLAKSPKQNRHLPSKDHGDGHDNGHDAGHSM